MYSYCNKFFVSYMFLFFQQAIPSNYSEASSLPSIPRHHINVKPKTNLYHGECILYFFILHNLCFMFFTRNPIWYLPRDIKFSSYFSILLNNKKRK